MSNSPKILIATPTADIKDYCFDAWSDYLHSITYENKEILIVDNSKNPDYYKKIINKGFNCIHYEPKKNENIREIMCTCNNIIRDYFLSGSHDFLFSIESDIFTAPNILEHLLWFKKKVIGLTYFIYHSYLSQIINFEGEDFGVNPRKYIPHLYKNGFLFIDGQLKIVRHVGMGCLLIKREILEKIKFRVDNEDWRKGHADTYFHEDLAELGIPVYCDTANMAHHFNGNWRKIYKNFKD
jgi:hypothetical protein